MARLIFLLLTAALGYWMWTSGLLPAAMNGFKPVPDRPCELVGPLGRDVYFAPYKEDTHYPIDAHIGIARDNMRSRAVLLEAIDRGYIVCLPSHTPAVVLDNDVIDLYRLKWPIVKVRIGSGDNSVEGWVERDNVVDNPLAALFVRPRKGQDQADH